MSDTSSLDTLARLQDIRLRVYNHERISPADMRALLDDIRRDRDSASRASAKTRAAARKAAGAPPTAKLDIDSLFGGGK